ncbi:MAG TPA: carboxypeptidase-like regulatory domain-containing protein [Ktedonobacterales bacterium]
MQAQFRRLRAIGLVLGLVVVMGLLVVLSACAPGSAGVGSQGVVNTELPSPTCPAGQAGQPCSSQLPKGTLNGEVLAGPTCPVERAEQPCPPKPVPNRVVLVETTKGSVITQVTTDQQGRFTIALPPGTYDLLVASVAGQFPIQRKPQQVTILAGQTQQVQIMLDTGIR